MKILLSSFAFAPSVGGIESVSEILAREFVRAGHRVHVITETPSRGQTDLEFEVTRQPGLKRLLSLLKEHDLFFQNNISLRTLLPVLPSAKPKVVTHQTWLRDARGRTTWNNRIKRAVLPFVTNVAISRAVGADLGHDCEIIPNPYRDETYHSRPEIRRDRDLVFLGRLVSDKGADLLLQSLVLLKKDNLHPRTTIIGSGPEEETLRASVNELGLTEQIGFTGPKKGVELARLLNAHRAIVIPSRWREPFGVVALEGIASGCVAVASAEGGLPDAVGRCGVTFPNEDVEALAAAIRQILTDPGAEDRFRATSAEHLENFKAARVADHYLRLFERLLR